MNSNQPSSGSLTWRASRTAVRNENDLEHHRDREDRDRDDERGGLVRMAQLLDAFVEREQPTTREEHDRHHESPEVALACVPERMTLGRGAFRSAGTEEQEALVSGVGHRVDRLGHERGRAGDREADELGDCDPEVGRQRRQDCLPLPAVCSPAIWCQVERTSRDGFRAESEPWSEPMRRRLRFVSTTSPTRSSRPRSARCSRRSSRWPSRWSSRPAALMDLARSRDRARQLRAHRLRRAARRLLHRTARGSRPLEARVRSTCRARS